MEHIFEIEVYLKMDIAYEAYLCFWVLIDLGKFLDLFSFIYNLPALHFL